ncbi:peptide MFS transporter [Deefgea sp. CFH1-16]|uniref:peptide MFS transporter n=1 Tax=Deefgea sp. CFH1-16 TaxID=2675457 RepID=UPI001FFC9202|nr:peptide MFS transporter [Deefgea sp. CFH1-16]
MRAKMRRIPIFYMGINLGSFCAPLICGTLGDTGNPADFRWGFLAAGVGMLLSLVIFQAFKNKYLLSPEGQILGLPPKQLSALEKSKVDTSLSTIDIQRMIVIGVLAFFVVFFWSAFEQAGVSLTFFARESTDRMIYGFEVPASWFQSLNPVFVLIFAPIMARLWMTLSAKGKEPSSPTKMAWGLILLGLGYVVIAFGVDGIDAGMKVSILWLVSMYWLHTMGELCLSPIGLSLVNKLAPARFASLLMAVWFLANAAANWFAGILAGFYPESGKPFPSFLGWQVSNLHDFFMLLFVAMSFLAGGLLLFASKPLQKMMHGIR